MIINAFFYKNTKMRSIILFILLGISTSVFGQVKIIKGRVVNAKSQEGIEFTSIGIEGTFLGTVSNTDGFFELKLPPEYQNHNITFSSIGYNSKVYPVSQLLNQEFVRVSLEERVYEIEGVSVIGRSRVVFRILRDVKQHIPDNYTQGPFNLQFYYLEQYSSGNSVIQNREGIVDMYDQSGYKNPSVLDAFQNRGYKFTQAKKDFASWSFPSGQNGFDELLEMDVVRLGNTILNEGLILDYDAYIERTIPYENDSAMVISYRMTNPGLAYSGDCYATAMEGKIYVLKQSNVVIRNECVINSNKNNWQNRALFTNHNFLNNVSYRFVSVYGKTNDKYILNYIECTKSYVNEKGEKMNYYRKASPVSFRQAAGGNTTRNYFEDTSYVESFWNAFERP